MQVFFCSCYQFFAFVKLDMDKNKNKTLDNILAVILMAVVAVFVFDALYKGFLHPIYKRHIANNHEYDVLGGMTDELRDCDLFEDMQSGRSFCFLGDSITYGNVSYGIRWCQPLIKYIKGNVSYLSYPGWKVQDLIDHRDIIISADVYVIAIGINDVIDLGNEGITASEFTARCEYLAYSIKKINPDAVIYFIAPWNFFKFDKHRVNRGVEFRASLGEWCSQTEYRYINPEPYIKDAFTKKGTHRYMENQYHPNAPEGVELFSYAVLKADHETRSARR